MRQDVMHLEKFYASPMGAACLAMAQRRIGALWSGPMNGEDVLGFGYAAPYLKPYMPQTQRSVLAMPAEQGGMIMHSKRGNITCLCEEDSLPFPPASFDRIIVAHGLEDSPCLPQLMSEFWRVLKPEGRIVIIASNRAGLWARSDVSPFGHGRPFSRSQLSTLLKQAKLEPMVWAGALYVPPVKWMIKPRMSRVTERFGETVWPRFSGLVLVEAVKRLYADINPAAGQTSRAPIFVGAQVKPSANTMNNKPIDTEILGK